MQRLAYAFVMGAILFPILDGMHTHFGVLAYTHPSVLGMAWWVPIEFGAMWVLVAISVPMLERSVGDGERRDTTTTQALGETAAFAAVYATTALLASRGSVRLGLLLAVPLAARFFFGAARRDAIFVVASAILGPMGETLVSSTGSFHYAQRELGLVPIWLPLLWAHGGFFGRRIFRHPLFAPALSRGSDPGQPETRSA
jgi:hypothetical protein